MLLVGLRGLGAEVAKNLILAGVKALTMLDPQQVRSFRKNRGGFGRGWSGHGGVIQFSWGGFGEVMEGLGGSFSPHGGGHGGVGGSLGPYGGGVGVVTQSPWQGGLGGSQRAVTPWGGWGRHSVPVAGWGLGRSLGPHGGVARVSLPPRFQVSPEDTRAQFLIPGGSEGRNRAQASLERAQTLNPMVAVRADGDSLESKSEDFFGQFDAVSAAGGTSAAGRKRGAAGGSGKG